MKFKSVKYNKKGLKRSDNTAPMHILPKKDLTSKNMKITFDKHYIKVIKKNNII